MPKRSARDVTSQKPAISVYLPALPRYSIHEHFAGGQYKKDRWYVLDAHRAHTVHRDLSEFEARMLCAALNAEHDDAKAQRS